MGYQTIHIQAISLLHLLGYLAKPAFVVGFIRLSNQRLHTRSTTTRHIQANRRVYQTVHIQSIFPIGFIRLPRKWEGRTTKLVRSSAELRTPSQDLSGLDFPNAYTPNTRKCPFLCSKVPQAKPSLVVLLRMCIAGLPSTLILL